MKFQVKRNKFLIEKTTENRAMCNVQQNEYMKKEES